MPHFALPAKVIGAKSTYTVARLEIIETQLLRFCQLVSVRDRHVFRLRTHMKFVKFRARFATNISC